MGKLLFSREGIKAFVMSNRRLILENEVLKDVVKDLKEVVRRLEIDKHQSECGHKSPDGGVYILGHCPNCMRIF